MKKIYLKPEVDYVEFDREEILMDIINSSASFIDTDTEFENDGGWWG